MESPNYPRQFPVSNAVFYTVPLLITYFSDRGRVQVESVARPHPESVANSTKVSPVYQYLCPLLDRRNI